MLGFALAVSILHAYFRDVAPILSAALLPWFFVSPIFFRIDSITRSEATAHFVLEWVNPVAPFIVAMRDVIYGGVVPRDRRARLRRGRRGVDAARRPVRCFDACRTSWRWSCEPPPAALDDGVRAGRDRARARLARVQRQGRPRPDAQGDADRPRSAPAARRRCRRCATSRCASSRARPSAWSGATARASPRRCACCRGSCR